MGSMVAEEVFSSTNGFSLGDCVEVFGLESETGKLLNSQKGILAQYVEEKGRFEVKFVPEKRVNLRPENLRKLDDRERFESLHTEMLRVVEDESIRSRLARLRRECENEEHFGGEKDKLVGSACGPAFERHGVDIGWFLHFLGQFGAEDEEIGKRHQRFEEFTAYSTTGPQGLSTGDCVDLFGFESGSGKEHLNGKVGVVKHYLEDKEKFEVLVAPECVNVKLENLRKLETRERFDRLQQDLLDAVQDVEASSRLAAARKECRNSAGWGEQLWKVMPELTGPVFQKYGSSWEWYEHHVGIFCEEDLGVKEKHELYEKVVSFGTLGPLQMEKGSCAIVASLTSESGQALNGRLGLIQSYDEGKDRYEIHFGPETVVNLKPENLRPATDRERFDSLQGELLELMSGRQMKAQVAKFRETCGNSMQYGKAYGRLCEKFHTPIYERHSADFAWFQFMLHSLAEEDEGVRKRSEELEELTSFGTLGTAGLEKGTFFEIAGLASEAGQKMNGSVVMLRGWNDEKGRYEVVPPDDVGAVSKALKAENLVPIVEKTLDSIEAAWALAVGLREAYEAPATQEMLTALRQRAPDVPQYLALLRHTILPVQAPVLERFGFRPDFVGQNHMQKTLSMFEVMSAELAQYNMEVERLLGLPPR